MVPAMGVPWYFMNQALPSNIATSGSRFYSTRYSYVEPVCARRYWGYLPTHDDDDDDDFPHYFRALTKKRKSTTTVWVGGNVA
mmetsp:Transcript_69297/g.135996  ORF Transcript_69297/g.135996 Transcript_69297/m.135996 type:complete len:83 (+) Transcript_69297:72-320(+)